MLLCVGLPINRELGEAITRHLDTMCDALEPWSTGGRYFNFAERQTGLEMLFDSDTLARLREVKRRYDPGDLICANHPIAIA